LILIVKIRQEMFRSHMYKYLLVFSAFLVILVAFPASPVAAQEICFPDQPSVPSCLNDPFAQYWQSNGGLPVFGYPIAAAQPERNPESNAEFLTQWTERMRLEFHPANADPHKVLLGRLGAERLMQLGRDPAAEGREGGPQPGCLWFAETGHNVCDQSSNAGFKTFWESNGLRISGLNAYAQSLMLFGLPLTAAQMEPGADGELHLIQWFERARFEWHPNNPDRFKVLLGLLGTEMGGGASIAAATPPVFGVETNRGLVGQTAVRIGEANLSWVRYNGILWSEVESSQGERNWGTLDGVAAELQAVTAQGGVPLVIIRSTPAWAQKVPGAECGPIKPEALDTFADFMRELVLRFKDAPYNVKYWEFGNEPDVDPSLVGSNGPFGCWGDAKDEYYGGGYYAEMLKRVYPAIKAADPETQVVVGGLLLDCDPANPSSTKDCKSGRFLEGILRNGGGEAFDILAYHSYTYWSRSAGDWDREHPGWRHRGGVVLGKLAFLRETLSWYGVNKPILMNEGGLLCYRSSPSCMVETFYNDQANYAVRLYARTWANGLLGSIWYTLDGPGWQEGGLLDANQAPRPAYQALRFMANLLDGASYAGSLGSGALERYAFRKGATTYQIYWTNDRSTVEITLPENTRVVYNSLGQAVQAVGPTLGVGFEPLYIEIGS
jgi:hypothetical protein